MTTRYEVIKAETSDEALAKSRWKPGSLARCIEVEAVANSDGTFSVFPICEPIDSKAQLCILPEPPCDCCCLVEPSSYTIEIGRSSA